MPVISMCVCVGGGSLLRTVSVRKSCSLSFTVLHNEFLFIAPLENDKDNKMLLWSVVVSENRESC